MDARDREAAGENKWYDKLDEKRMVLIFTLCGEDDDGDFEETVELPAKFDVCGLCHGQGKHVNPSIDSCGISAQDFYDDPDFAESYFSGVYDENCYRCGSSRVEPVLDEERLTAAQKEILERLERKWQDDANYYAECAAERRMGC